MDPCCFASACNLEASFCNDCGSPLLRCAAYEECGGLVNGDGCCEVCFAPQLTLQSGKIRKGTVGGSLAIPLELANLSSVGRPVFVKGVWMREGRGKWERSGLSWDRLDAGSSKPLTLIASEMDRAGVHRLEIVVALASRWKWREEVFAFSTIIDVNVEENKELVVQQNINYAADAPQHGATIYAPVRVNQSGATTADETSDSQELVLTRASVYEKTLGLRGNSDGPSVRRDTRIEWRGFADSMSPADTPIVTGDSRLVFGRSRTKANDGNNDVRLLVFKADGSLDEEMSRGISREHFCLWIENDRLNFRVDSDNGAWVDGRELERGESIELSDGSCFSPFRTQSHRLSITAKFEAEHNDVVNIVMTRNDG